MESGTARPCETRAVFSFLYLCSPLGICFFQEEDLFARLHGIEEAAPKLLNLYVTGPSYSRRIQLSRLFSLNSKFLRRDLDWPNLVRLLVLIQSLSVARGVELPCTSKMWGTFSLWLCRGSSGGEVEKLVVPGLDRHLINIHHTCSGYLKLHNKIPHKSEV